MYLSRRWKNKPPNNPQIQWGHPLADGLVGCYLLNTGQRPYNLVTGRLAGGTPDAPVTAIEELGLSFNGSNQDVQLEASTLMSANRPGLTMIARVAAASTSAGNHVIAFFSRGDVNNSARAQLARAVGAWRIAGRSLDTDGNQVLGTGTVTAGKLTTLCGIFDYPGDRIFRYENGLRADDIAATFGANNSDTTASLTWELGSNGAGTGELWDGTIHWVYVYSRVRHEIQKWVHEEPFSFLAPTIGRNYFLLGTAGASPQTIAAGGQTVTLTNPTAALSAGNANVAAGVNTVTITAPDAVLSTAGSQTLVATENLITLTNPAAVIASGNVNITAGAQTVTTTAPVAALVGLLDLLAGSQTITFTNPTASLGTGNANIAAGSQTIVLTAPQATLDDGIPEVVSPDTYWMMRNK